MDLVEIFAREEAADRRRWRRALALAAAAHLLLLVTPLPSFRQPPGNPGGERPVFVLEEVRFAPPRVEPEPLPPEPPAEEEQPEEAETEEPEEARLGPPPVEVLFAESELSRLVPPQAVAAPPPPYPDAAREAGVAGDVILRLQLDAAGEILDVRVEDGPPELATAARDAALGWRFLPGTLDGVPIPVVVEVRVRFTPGRE
ncbi:MAG TPA: energy transducer TonB [Thermoanaerobaculia bacterium]|nr:energy transducer TonB [Thermoanaerobaculia bacterium]